MRRLPLAGTPLPSAASLVGGIALATQLVGCACNENNVVGAGPTEVTDEDEAYEPLEGDWGAWLSMAVDKDDQPVITYYNRTDGALGFATATWTEDNELRWIHEEVDGYADESGFDSANRGAYTALTVAADGTFWVVYQDVQNEALRYATRAPDATEWESGVADTEGEAGFYASIALDSFGNPVATHYAQGDGALRVTRWDGSKFTAETVDEGDVYGGDTGGELEPDVGRFSSIAVYDSIEYIAYYDVANGDLKLAWGAAGAYTIEVVDSEGDVGTWPDLLIKDGLLHIAYHDKTNGDLKLAVGTPGNFELEVVDSGDHVGADSHVWLSGDQLQIAYFDGRNNDMKQAYASGDDWQSRTLTEEPGAMGFHNEVVVAAGQTWAGCYDYTNRSLWFQSID